MADELPKIPVSQDALYRVLCALNGLPHQIRELQATRGLPGDVNPIDVLIADFNAWVESQAEPPPTCG
jgi:hypothetical protein